MAGRRWLIARILFLMSFLEQAMAAASVTESSVPEELLDEWCDPDDDTLPVAFLMHPRVRGDTTEEDVRHIVEKKHLQLTQRVSADDFLSLAGKLQRRGSSRATMRESAAEGSDPLQEWYDRVDAMLATPQWTADEKPARLADDLLVGSAAHAADVAELSRLQVAAVVNCAEQTCNDPTEAYAAHGIQYMAIAAEDFEDYPLLDLHLAAVEHFYQEHRGTGAVLIHCFAGINRSACLGVALLMLRERWFLLRTVQHCFERRPFILSNVSFRRALVRLASQRGLLDGAELGAAEVRVVEEALEVVEETTEAAEASEAAVGATGAAGAAAGKEGDGNGGAPAVPLAAAPPAARPASSSRRGFFGRLFGTSRS